MHFNMREKKSLSEHIILARKKCPSAYLLMKTSKLNILVKNNNKYYSKFFKNLTLCKSKTCNNLFLKETTRTCFELTFTDCEFVRNSLRTTKSKKSISSVRSCTWKNPPFHFLQVFIRSCSSF